ncbi:MAG: hypothetical protein MJZ30_04690 [Paludibacteraceae bacterium]|nr:hypothetical protein [Paludibacteraceae bacterium]
MKRITKSKRNEIIIESVKRIREESAITLEEHTYPQYGNVLILAGGAECGNSFALDNEIAFEGKHFDVDFIKEQIKKFQMNSPIDTEYFKLYGKHISQTNLNDEQDVSNLHSFCNIKKFDRRTVQQFIQHASSRTTKDNMIFDITLHNVRKLIEIVNYCDMSGYNRENIHIVWVIKDCVVTQQQNMIVSDDILARTHIDVSKTIHDILTNAEELVDDSDGSPLIDGDMWILFNKKNVDNFAKSSTIIAGKHIDKIAIKIKEKDQPIKPFEDIMAEISEKKKKD